MAHEKRVSFDTSQFLCHEALIHGNYSPDRRGDPVQPVLLASSPLNYSALNSGSLFYFAYPLAEPPSPMASFVKTKKATAHKRAITKAAQQPTIDAETYLRSAMQQESKDMVLMSRPNIGTDSWRPSEKLPMGVPMSMFGFERVLKIRMTRVAQITTSGAGAAAIVTGMIPSNFDQYNQLATLFSAARLVATRYTFTNLQPQTVAQTTWALGFDPSGIAGSSYTFTQNSRLVGSMIFTTYSTVPFIRTRWFRPAKGRPWSDISATATGTDPQGGIIGAWVLNNDTALALTTTYVRYLIEAIYEVRSQF